MGYAAAEIEHEIVRAQLASHPIDDLESVLDPEEVVGVRKVVRSTHVSDSVLDYALKLTIATRSHEDLALGASPRASIVLVRCAQARALLDGREFVTPDDVKALAVPALAHRVLPNVGLRLEPGRATKTIRDIVESTAVPVTDPV